jgi:hypothetical protein
LSEDDFSQIENHFSSSQSQMSITREASPTTVQENIYRMPILRRFTIITRRTGAKYYDIYLTMERQEYYGRRGDYNWEAWQRNCDALSNIRYGAVAMDSEFFDVYERRFLQRLGAAAFFHQHGVECPKEAFEEQEEEARMLEVAEQAEAALALINIEEDAISLGSIDTISLSSSEIDQDLEEFVVDIGAWTETSN